MTSWALLAGLEGAARCCDERDDGYNSISLQRDRASSADRVAFGSAPHRGPQKAQLCDYAASRR